MLSDGEDVAESKTRHAGHDQGNATWFPLLDESLILLMETSSGVHRGKERADRNYEVWSWSFLRLKLSSIEVMSEL